MIPVSVRTGMETERWTNRVSAIFASIPVDEPDPLERVRKVHEAMVDAKQLFDAVPAETLTDFTQFPPPAVFALAMRTATRLTGRYGNPVNLVGLSAGLIAGIGGVSLKVTDDFELSGIALGTILVIVFFHMVKGGRHDRRQGAEEVTRVL